MNHAQSHGTGDHENKAGSWQSHATDGDSKHIEGPIAKAIETQTTKLPSDIFLWAAGASIVASLALQLMGRKAASAFVGQWAPTVLILGLYNKFVKVAGSDPLPTKSLR